MYYVILALLILVVFIVATRILSSLIKGCFVAVSLFLIVITIFLLYKSTVEPIEVFGIYRIDSFRITKLEKNFL
ncbi:hypothetical protein A2473_02815 [candidate division WWE3 bacterium RIFOXYC2_FULL_42_13]|uniref:Uncharacterized protein n=1 Tax=candidate division WWE3 bacterium TaxID=2053526 RepID=A0A3D0ZRK5_UNCKA|nr:MAG: hypothetical protein A2245_01280 [candidate division WWE3 bacterium RIFOXYA2_FULL_43_12]OGC64583.1 MAG: hypothetical protein A2274_01085 [candidate division WWE3 bacterium RIFOXYA12_FULL_43_11]OGC72018.1 MAG: hypothetical protein A2337_01465 [candidate division WWE3 bacterium RIFOXYB2_FULL_43_9]OGC73425.1 MAG: hypothetical protein A2473_02815 [candidate division WWE3 bacterium RIFOXYC2_FULL_42_13]OGC75701.1 MAG: hypothetical protein A2547_03200 [candidate division WWE3 bacterium RIFOXYD